MIAYILMYFVVILGVVNHKNPKFGYLSWAILLFFSIFRGEMVGTDTSNYLSYGATTLRSSMVYGDDSYLSVEILTNLVYRFIDAGANPRWIITFFSVVMFVFFILLARRSKINLAYLMMVFLLGGGYIYSFNIARQWTAMVIVAYATTYIFEEDKRKSLLFFPFILLANSIHAISIYYVVLYVFRYVKLRIPVAFVFVIACFLMSVLGIFIMDVGFVNNLTSGYVDNYGDALNVLEARSFLGWMVSLFFVVMYFLMMQSLYKQDSKDIVPLFAFCVGLNILTIQMDSTIHRFFMFLTFLISVFVAKYFSMEKDKSMKTILISSYVLLSTYLFFTSGIMDDYYFTFDIF